MKTNFFNFRHSPKQSITLLALIILGLGFTTQAWAWNWSSGTVYLDNTVTATFPGLGSTPYFRIGTNTHNTAITMTKVPGTAALYSATGTYNNFGAYNVANDYGWTGNNNPIIQPYYHEADKQVKPTTNCMTRATTYKDNADINSDIYIIPTTFKNKDHEKCDYYNWDLRTEGWTITISTPKGGSIKVEKYNNDEGTDLTQINSGDVVLPTQYIKATVISQPDAHYTITKINIGGSEVSIGGKYAVRGNVTVQPVYTEIPYEVTLTGFTAAKTTAYYETTGSATLKVPAGKAYSNYNQSNLIHIAVSNNTITFNATANGSLTANYVYLTPVITHAGTATYEIGGAAIKLDPQYSQIADDATYAWTGSGVTFSATDVPNPNVSAATAGNYTVRVTVNQGGKSAYRDITLTVTEPDDKCASCFPQTGSTAQ